jgi:AAA family ATP:ADP antiporter
LSADAATAPRPSGFIERLLRPFSDVREGEGPTVLLFFFNLFLLMLGYYVLKTVREPLILSEGGAELRSYASAAQAVCLMGFIPLYGWFSSKVERVRLVVGVTLFFITCLELFFLGGGVGIPYLGFAFFVWLGLFNMSTVAQFWSYANDVHTGAEGERLFPVIAVGATAGSPLGSWLAGELFARGVGPYAMMQIAAGLLLAHMLLYVVIDRRLQRRARGAQGERHEALGGPGGFALVLRSPYILLLAVLLMILNVVNTTGEYMVSRSVQEAAAGLVGEARDAFIGAFYGREYQLWVNIIAVLLQAFVASRLVKSFGVAGVLFALPLVSLGAYGLISASAGFAMVRWAKTAENATDYSIMNTARQLLWLPTSREEKYKAKQTTDTFFVRAGDVLSAGVVFVGTAWLGLSVEGFALVNVALVVVWLALAVRLLRRNRELVAARAAER